MQVSLHLHDNEYTHKSVLMQKTLFEHQKDCKFVFRKTFVNIELRTSRTTSSQPKSMQKNVGTGCRDTVASSETDSLVDHKSKPRVPVSREN